MKKTIAITLNFIFLLFNSQAQEWIADTGELDGYCTVSSSVLNKDGKFVFAGGCGVDKNNLSGCLVIIDENGNMENHIYGHPYWRSYFYQIIQLDNGNYFLNGQCEERSNNKLHLWVAVIGSDFELIHEEMVIIEDNYLDIEPGRMTVDDNGNIITLASIIYSSGINASSEALFKYSPDGIELKRKYFMTNDPTDPLYSYRNRESFQLLNAPMTDEIMMLGPNISTDLMTIFDEELNFKRNYELWEFDFSPVSYYTDVWVSDDEFILCTVGRLESVSNKCFLRVNRFNLEAESLDVNEISITDRSLTSVGHSTSVSAIDDNLYYVLCHHEVSFGWPVTPIIYLMDKNLEVIAQKELDEGEITTAPYFIYTTKDNGCIVGRLYYKDSYMHQGYHIYKYPITDFDPTWSVSETENAGITSDVYPNPATNTLHLNIDEDATLSITDIQGRKLLQKNVSCGDNEIDISGLNSGMYIYQINGNDSENKIGKFIKK